MKRALTIVSGLLLSAAAAMAQAPAPQTITLSAAVQRGYNGVKQNLTEMAAKMPEADYGFKPGPAPEMRTFGQLFAPRCERPVRLVRGGQGGGEPEPGQEPRDRAEDQGGVRQGAERLVRVLR